MTTPTPTTQTKPPQTKRRGGTFCVIVQQQLTVSNCPLPRGACIWKHQVTGFCKYDPSHSDISLQDLADLVGRPVPTEDQFNETKDRLTVALTEELRTRST